MVLLHNSVISCLLMAPVACLDPEELPTEEGESWARVGCKALSHSLSGCVPPSPQQSEDLLTHTPPPPPVSPIYASKASGSCSLNGREGMGQVVS